MAVENDYNLLVHNLNDITDCLVSLREEVRERRLTEARDQLEINTTDWVNLIALRLGTAEYHIPQLVHDARTVLRSRPGEAAFDAEPPGPPDAPPHDL